MTIDLLGITSEDDASGVALRLSWVEAREALAAFHDSGGDRAAAARCLEAYHRFAYLMGCTRPATRKLVRGMAGELLAAVERRVVVPLAAVRGLK